MRARTSVYLFVYLGLVSLINILTNYFECLLYFLDFFFCTYSMAVSFRKNFIEGAGGVKNAYANKVFCAWDFGIATQEAAELQMKSIHTEFKVRYLFL